ncbi:MAG: ferric reductase-like transmembrane domain-containing protein [Novosphingobium sp.]|nr:ferric reductase-like transmembrane domain-containing protein [Novosphingobium sp.]MCB2080940.1 ferric reductase-like transmembrane domain-containing protein [Novosphingobium sp.]
MGSWKKYLLWLVLALPAAFMLHSLVWQDTLPMDLLHPSGELSVRLMVLAMLPGPLSEFFGENRLLRFWLSMRRYFGVAAFAYALLHLAVYVLDMRSLPAILDEFTLPGIWTGWLALVLLLPAACTSFDAAMRRLKRNWKRVQRIIYLAFLAGLVHWLLLDWEWRPAVIHAAPLVLAWTLRFVARIRTDVGRPLS